jgi:NADH-quinone oxidoreductase subunit N
MNIDLNQIILSFGNFWPEIALGIFFVVALLIDAFVKGEKRTIMGLWSILGFIVAGWLALRQSPLLPAGAASSLYSRDLLGAWLFKAGHQPFGMGMLVVDSFSVFFKLLIALAGILVCVFSMTSRELMVDGKPRLGEYFSLLLAMSFGMFLMVGANDLLLMYLSIEIVSLCSYSIVGFTKNVARSSEASMKYVIYGGLSSGVMLFGISLVYGLVGSTNFGEIMNYLGTPNAEQVLVYPMVISSVMILAGLGYKISAAPFHFWTPDVYEGAPITMTAFLSVASKAAGFALLVRFVVSAFPPSMQQFSWGSILGAIAVLTMTLGNFAALQQSNLKRLLAYSSIAHAGYMLLGLVVGTTYGVSAILIYFAIYLVMNLGGFFAVQKISEQIGSEEIEDFRGLGPRMPVVGVFFSVFMIALVGLPPTSGFIAKLFLFSALINSGDTYLWLAIIAVLNSVVSLYYYVRVLKVMYLEKPQEDAEIMPIRIGTGSTALLGVLAVVTILLGLPTFFGPLVDFAQHSLGAMTRLLQDGGPGTMGGL